MKRSDIRIAVVDDNKNMRLGMERAVAKDGYIVESFANPLDFLSRLAPERYHIVISDFKMPDMDGVELIKRIKEVDSTIVTLLVTGFATVENTVDAIKNGAFDVMSKPFNLDDLKVMLHKAENQLRQNREINHLRGRTKKDIFYGMIGQSNAMHSIFSLVERIAPRDVTVLITGASGTGKELLAQAIHRLSHVGNGPFVPVNCGAVPETLIDAELFGYKKGAFTGATSNREGLIRSADNGTLFLDEIGDLPFQTQLRLLRFLQEKEIRPVGSDETYSSNTRVIAATHRNMAELVERGEFREDLYYRLSVVPIKIPPLSERRDDIPLLVMHFIQKASRKHSLKQPRIESDAMEALEKYDWPGNVRELENTIERLVLLSDGSLSICDLPSQIRGAEISCANESMFDDMSLSDLEKWHILRTIERMDGNRTKAADHLDISRRTLQRKLKDWGMN